MILSHYAIAGLIGLMIVGIGFLAAALWRPGTRTVASPPAWKPYHFGYPVYALIFVSFDMEMIYMYPWAVVFADLGFKAFLDMLVFIAILSAGIAYAWGMGGLAWE